MIKSKRRITLMRKPDKIISPLISAIEEPPDHPETVMYFSAQGHNYGRIETYDTDGPAPFDTIYAGAQIYIPGDYLTEMEDTPSPAINPHWVQWYIAPNGYFDALGIGNNADGAPFHLWTMYWEFSADGPDYETIVAPLLDTKPLVIADSWYLMESLVEVNEPDFSVTVTHFINGSEFASYVLEFSIGYYSLMDFGLPEISGLPDDKGVYMTDVKVGTSMGSSSIKNVNFAHEFDDKLGAVLDVSWSGPWP